MDFEDLDNNNVVEAAKDEVLLEIKEVFIYTIPFSLLQDPSYLHRAKDWDLPNPDGSFKLILVGSENGNRCLIKLEWGNGSLFGQSLIDFYPGDFGSFSASTLNSVSDSTRYFTLKIKKRWGNYEVVGLGFSNRALSSELTTALINYFASRYPNGKLPEPEPEPSATASSMANKDNMKIRSSLELEMRPAPAPGPRELDLYSDVKFDNNNTKDLKDLKEKQPKKDMYTSRERESHKKELDRQKKNDKKRLRKLERKVEQKILVERKRIEELQRQNSKKRMWKNERTDLDH